MDTFRVTLRAATIAFLLGGLWGGASLPSAKENLSIGSISPERVADYVHAVLEADRTIYTTHIVNRMQEKGLVAATEHWEQDNALPLPAQFLQHSGRLVAERWKRHPLQAHRVLPDLSTQRTGDRVRAKSAGGAQTTA